MRNSILLFFLIVLIITTTIIKNSSKNLENQIFVTNENINILKNQYELVLLEFNFLTSPKQLLDYQSKYFENNLISKDITKMKLIVEQNEKLIISEFNNNIFNNE
tara:strand:- start:2747 stop:3061 length:315 start_codon:yes stop_codon:yes gene_type:complete